MSWIGRVGVTILLTIGPVLVQSLYAEEPATVGVGALPRSLDPRLKIELFAESPQIVTPTGIDVDHLGRVWAIESNTHFPPNGYKGHKTDRVLVMQDTNGDGKADKIVTFTDGLTHTMSIAVRPSGDIYLVTRREIFLCHDDDGDLRMDRKRRIIHLDTPGNYPHNGLAGLAFDAMGSMYFGCGENLGAAYKLIGSDKKTLSGGGEGGNLYRCQLYGASLTHWATGFWNPHASCLDAFGRLFTVDNDADSRPPCRLLHIIRDGDYGFRFRNGRKGLHPFTAWDGEIPGTLPMVAGTGEAPSGIVAYESDGFPKEYVGDLLVGSWGDHRIDRFRLKPHGASFRSKTEPLIVGGENFRPVGLAVAPDGSLFCTDWVLRDYKVHSQGRVWRVSAVKEPKRAVIDVTSVNRERPLAELKKLLDAPRIDIRRAAANALAKSADDRKHLLKVIGDVRERARKRIEVLWAIANVPLEVEDFGFVGDKKRGAKIAQEYDEVGNAALSLLGTPQFRVDRQFLKQLMKFESDLVIKPKQKPMPWRVEHELLVLLQFVPLDEKQKVCFNIALSRYDPFLFAATVNSVSRSSISVNRFNELISEPSAGVLDGFIETDKSWHQLAYFLAARKKFPRSQSTVELGLKHPDQRVRRAAVQWVAEERLTKFRPQLEAILNGGGITNELFLATLAGLEMLDGVNPKDFDKTPASEYVMRIVRDESRPATLRAQALRMLPVDAKGLDEKLLGQLVGSDNAALRLAAVRTLQHSPLPGAGRLLEPIAANEEYDVNLRAEAGVGLATAVAGGGTGVTTVKMLTSWLTSDSTTLRSEGIRSLRSVANTNPTVRSAVMALVRELELKSKLSDQDRDLADQLALALSAKGKQPPSSLAALLTKRPVKTADWVQQVGSGGDPASGRRIFYHINSAGCYKCHTVNGRGGRVGPDLSTIARTMNRKKLAESILEPSREIAPQFVNWTVVTTSGKVHNGLILEEDREGRIRIGDAEGKIVELAADQVEERKPQKTSVMPDKLIDRLTVGELRDLLAYLETLK